MPFHRKCRGSAPHTVVIVVLYAFRFLFWHFVFHFSLSAFSLFLPDLRQDCCNKDGCRAELGFIIYAKHSFFLFGRQQSSQSVLNLNVCSRHLSTSLMLLDISLFASTHVHCSFGAQRRRRLGRRRQPKLSLSVCLCFIDEISFHFLLLPFLPWSSSLSKLDLLFLLLLLLLLLLRSVCVLFSVLHVAVW